MVGIFCLINVILPYNFISKYVAKGKSSIEGYEAIVHPTIALCKQPNRGKI